MIRRITYRKTEVNPVHTRLSIWVNGGPITEPGGICLRHDEVEEFIKRLEAISEAEYIKSLEIHHG